MRMANERDQAFLTAAVSDAANLLAFVPLLGTGEVIAFGEGVPLPARMKFRELPAEALPRSDTLGWSLAADGSRSGAAFLGAVVDRWRGATMHKGVAEAEPQAARPVPEPAAEASSSVALDQAHRRLLRRSVESPAPPQPGLRAGGALWQSR